VFDMKPYYEHAGIVIYHADAREILPQLPLVDLLLTDPPYGIGENSKKNASRGKPVHTCPRGRNTRGTAVPATDYGVYNWDSKPADDDLIKLAINSAEQSIVWGGNYFIRALTPAPGWLVWDKLNGGDFADCELAWTNLQQAVRCFRHMWNGMLRASERDVPRCHPTQKPIALMAWCLGFVPNAKSMIDPFCGSGSSLVAAKKRGMVGIGIDLSEQYCEISAKRLSQEVLDFG
jgi:DNA modification methylase